MINRTLIRLKVVQALYSHLISRSDFHIFTEPTRNTKEAGQSFTVYCSIIALLLETAGHKILSVSFHAESENIFQPLLKNDRMLSILASSNDLKDLLRSNERHIEQPLKDLIVPMKENIAASSAYNDFIRKKQASIEDDIRFWETELNTTIKEEILSYFKSRHDFSSSAIEKGIVMVSETFKGYSDIRLTYYEAKKSLEHSLDESYRLYVGLLCLAIELTREREIQLETAKNKYLPSHEELNPDTKFIDNKFVKALRENKTAQNYISKKHIDWDTEIGLLKGLLSDILASNIYKEYMEKKTTSFSEDCELWRHLFQDVICQSDTLLEALESKSIYWNDDLYIIGTFVLKTIRSAAKDGNIKGVEILPMYKDEEDREFGIELFKDTITNQEEYRSYIDRFIKADWDLERIAFMDIVIMTTAISELINFPNIPMPVTMNEYTEIAADYSGGNSPKFVNGLLFSVAQELKKEGKINK